MGRIENIMKQAHRYIAVVLLQELEEIVRNLCNRRIRALNQNYKICTGCYCLVERAVEICPRAVKTRHIDKVNPVCQKLSARRLYRRHERSVLVHIGQVQSHMLVNILLRQRPRLLHDLRHLLRPYQAPETVYYRIHLLNSHPRNLRTIGSYNFFSLIVRTRNDRRTHRTFQIMGRTHEGIRHQIHESRLAGLHRSHHKHHERPVRILPRPSRNLLQGKVRLPRPATLGLQPSGRILPHQRLQLPLDRLRLHAHESFVFHRGKDNKFKDKNI